MLEGGSNVFILRLVSFLLSIRVATVGSDESPKFRLKVRRFSAETAGLNQFVVIAKRM